MAEITEAFAVAMLQRARQGKKTPLTAWEQQQLAFAWLRWNGKPIPARSVQECMSESKICRKNNPEIRGCCSLGNND